ACPGRTVQSPPGRRGRPARGRPPGLPRRRAGRAVQRDRRRADDRAVRRGGRPDRHRRGARRWFEAGLGAFWHGAERREQDIAAHTALGRWGTAADLTGVYLFLASAASAYITGTTITVDGGYSLL